MAKKRNLKNGYYIINETKTKDKLSVDIKIVGSDVRFFRFRSNSEYSIKAFLNDELGLSQPTTFNDPYDTYLTFNKQKVMDKIAEIQGSSHHELMKNKDIYDFVHQIMIDTIKKSNYVACFSEILDNPAMWAHYSNQGKGFVLEYGYTDIVETGRFLVDSWANQLFKEFEIPLEEIDKEAYEKWIDLHHSFYPMRYTNRSNDFTNELIKEIEEQRYYNVQSRDDVKKIFELQLNDELYKLNISMRNSLTTTKNTYWKYEREWRLNVTSFNLIDEYNGVYPVNPKAIYLGEFISYPDKYLLCSAARAKAIDVYQMYTKNTVKSNKLVYKKLTETEINNITNIK